jgi:peptidoglycan/xylan/chitin deacetylase (PgdA/CDA1 family)
LKSNTNVINIHDFFDNQLSADKINTVITFDDGYKGWVTNALPLLKRLDLPAPFLFHLVL